MRSPLGCVRDETTKTVGGTPLVRLARLTRAAAEIVAKLEVFNPTHLVKDRIGVAMPDRLAASGALRPGGTVIAATSGDTGTGLAFARAARDRPLARVMPESVSVKRRKVPARLGAWLEIAAEPGMAGKRIAAIPPRFAERCLSTALFDER